MNVIFLDFDGVLNTIHRSFDEDIENKIKILANICRIYNCVVVISSSHKDAIDDYTLNTNVLWIKHILDLFKKYNIKCIGKTPNVERKKDNGVILPVWKEDEIRLYLYRHLEVEHFVILDDDDYIDLKKLQKHLVKAINYSNNYEEEGLLESHVNQVGEILKLDNEIKKYVLKRKLITKH